MAIARQSLLQWISAPLRRLFDFRQPDASAAGSLGDRALQIAAATLLYEMARVDHHIREDDLRAVANALRELFALTGEQAQALVSHVSEPSRRPTSYYPFVRVINRIFTADQKRRLVEHMWVIALADREIHMYEDHLVRKIADLLYVPHREFIAAKHRARALRDG